MASAVRSAHANIVSVGSDLRFPPSGSGSLGTSSFTARGKSRRG